MTSYSDNIRRVKPYTPGEQPQGDVVKLNTNECPYPPSPMVAEKLAALNAGDLRKYPDPTALLLTQAIADYHGLPTEQVFVGVGSDDCLSMCFLTFFNSDKPILFPDITYSFYEVWAAVYNIPYRKQEVAVDFTIQPQSYFCPCGGVCLANPNAPTGIAMGLDDIESIVAYHKDTAIVIIDEAYIDFGGESALPLIKKYPNLAVVRTMSKSRALAGMRVGYVLSSSELIKYLNDVKFSVNSYTMNMPSLVAGAASIADEPYFRRTVDKIIDTRERTKKELNNLGFQTTDSATNFIFATHSRVNAAHIFDELKKCQIYVRYFAQPRIDNYLRITVGTDAEMDKLLSALQKLV